MSATRNRKFALGMGWRSICTHFLVMNNHFGGPSVHCGQILQKNPGKEQSPLAMPGFWVHMDQQPTPNSLNLTQLNIMLERTHFLTSSFLFCS